jgi:peptidoglycan/xylan/chitin deacetylase (PgdA/CDA1 family)
MKWVVALAFGLIFSAPAAAQPGFAWPDGRRAAIALTYDDSAPSQLVYAVPQLNAAGLKGTFYLTGKFMTPDSVPHWRAVAEAGHELGNHTINHPCLAGTYDMPVPYNSESYTVETLLTETRTMNTLLTAIDGASAHSFATPCGHTTAGGADYIAPLEASGLVTYIRDERATPVAPNGPPMSGTGFAEVDGAVLIAWVEQIASTGGGGIVVFHGVGGDYLSVSAEAHQELVNYLAAHRSEIWVATFTEMMDYVKANGQ